MRCIVVLLIMMVVGKTFANTVVKGRVLDRDSKMGIHLANVVFIKTDSSFIGGVTTDSLGNFRFLVSNNERLIISISHIAYEKLVFTMDLNQDAQRDTIIYMKSSGVALDYVAVVAKKKLIKSTVNNLEYTITDNIRKESLVAANVLDRIPSVYVDYNNNIFVNGSGNVLILKNGVELPNNSLLNNIPSKTIRKVSISTSIPPKYSTKNYSAIINIITDENSISKNINFDYRSSLNNLFYDINTNLYFAHHKSTFILYYKYYFRNIRSSLELMRYNNTAHITDASNMVTFPRKEMDNEFFCGYTYNFSEKFILGIDSYYSGYREYFTMSSADATLKRFSVNKENYITSSNRAYFLYSYKKLDLSGLVSYTLKDVVDRNTYFWGNDEDNLSQRYQKIQSNMDASYKISNTCTFSSGIDYTNLDTKYKSITERKRDGYSEDRLSTYGDVTVMRNFLTISGGYNLYGYRRSYLNYEKNNLLILQPKLSIIVKVNSSNSIKAGVYSSMDSPTLWQLFPSNREISSDVVSTGNLQLKPSTTMYSYLSHVFTKGPVFLDNELYFNSTKNKIEEKVSSSNQATTINFTNLDKSYSVGLRTTLNLDIASWYKIKLSNNLYQCSILDNIYIDDNFITVNSSIQNSIVFLKKLLLAYRYEYRGKALLYNGKYKPSNSSIIQIRYKPTNFMSLSMIAVQPIGKYKTTTYSYLDNGSVVRCETLSSQILLLSMTINIFKEKVKNTTREFYDEDKKR